MLMLMQFLFFFTIYTKTSTEIQHLIYIEHKKWTRRNWLILDNWKHWIGYYLANPSGSTKKTIQGLVHMLFWLVAAWHSIFLF